MTDHRQNEDFYVGYRTDNPTGQGRFTRSVVVLLSVLSLGIGALLTSLQAPFEHGIFEFGDVREVEGVLHFLPQPSITLNQPLGLPAAASADGTESETSALLLVEFGKHGAADLERLDGRSVRARGTLIARGKVAMLELAEPPEEVGVPIERPRDPSTSRQVTLTGEIVDSKCFLGVMKPGRGKVHRACATLCLEGGIPPAFLVRGEDGVEWVALLLDENGRAPERSLAPWVGEAVTIAGTVIERADGAAEFHADLDGQLN